VLIAAIQASFVVTFTGDAFVRLACGSLDHHRDAAPRHCTTCRIQILDGISHVSARNLFEEQIASTPGRDKFTRLRANEGSWRRDVVMHRAPVYGTIAETMINAAKYREERARRVSRNRGRNSPRLGRSVFAGRLTAIDTGAGPERHPRQVNHSSVFAKPSQSG
jgi:hypothetical protein